MAEGDPTRIATMAETMPDPPDLAEIAAAITIPVSEAVDPLGARPAASPPDPTPDALATAAVPSQDAPAPTTDHLAAEAEAALAARLEFAAAEAEADALTFTGEVEDDGSNSEPFELEAGTHPAPIIEGLAQADAGKLPALPDGERTTTRVIVVGLVSVASIATFKRGIGRADGVSAVSVASGPDGEFVFSVEHDATKGIGHAVQALRGFEARITAESPGTLQVTAHDPDTGV
jgi:hypothetical protein